MRVASFFSGIGGFDRGLENAGMQIVFQCEINRFCQHILRRHWPGVPLHDDIAALETKAIPESELWCAGFPCQDVSLANQGKRKGLKGVRSGLFFQFAGLIKQKCPKWVIMENVPGLLNSQNGRDFSTVISTLDEFGYGVAWRVLDAKFFGTPQRRRRVFIVASYRSPSAAQVLFDDRPTAIVARSRPSEEQSFSIRLRNSDKEADLYTIQHASIRRHDKAGPQAKGYRNDGETWTLDSRGSSDAVCAPYDAFRVREAPRVSGTMDGATGGVNGATSGANGRVGQLNGRTNGGNERGDVREIDSTRFRCIGNAVAVPVIEWIGRRIMRIEEETLELEHFEPTSEFFCIPAQIELF